MTLQWLFMYTFAEMAYVCPWDRNQLSCLTCNREHFWKSKMAAAAILDIGWLTILTCVTCIIYVCRMSSRLALNMLMSFITLILQSRQCPAYIHEMTAIDLMSFIFRFIDFWNGQRKFILICDILSIRTLLKNNTWKITNSTVGKPVTLSIFGNPRGRLWLSWT